MNRENKLKLLAAWDALTSIREPWESALRSGKSSGGYKCGCCGGLAGSMDPHINGCPVGSAIDDIKYIIPRYEEREKWLNKT